MQYIKLKITRLLKLARAIKHNLALMLLPPGDQVAVQDYRRGQN